MVCALISAITAQVLHWTLMIYTLQTKYLKLNILLASDVISVTGYMYGDK